MLSGVRDLRDIIALEQLVFGNKIINLSKAISCGIPVSPGFCVTFSLSEDFSTQMEQFFEEIESAYQALCPQDKASFPALIVRSSCELEDSEFLLFPGIFQSIHDVKSFDALLQAIETCYQSMQAVSVEKYMNMLHQKCEFQYFSVLIQIEQHPDYSGVASSYIPLENLSQDEGILIQLTHGSNQAFIRGIGPFSSYTVFPKNGTEIMYRRIRTQVQINPEKEYSLLRQLYQLLSELMNVFGKHINIEWGICQNAVIVFQIRKIQAFKRTETHGQGIAFFQKNNKQGFKYQAMQYFHSCGMFPTKALFFEKHTALCEVERSFKELDEKKPKTVRFSSKNEIGLPRCFAQCSKDALQYIRDTLQEDWALIVYNSIEVQDSYELYLDCHQAILEHVPGMWESDSQLFADTIYMNVEQTDYWLAQDDRLAKIEDSTGVTWQKTPPLSRRDAEILVKLAKPYIERLTADFFADLPLNFHFVSDHNQFYFLNCRRTEKITPPKDNPHNLYRVSTMDDLKDWDGNSSILFAPRLDRGEEVFLTEYVPFLKKAGVPIFVTFGILSHPAIMLREFGLAIQPFFPHHTHYVGGVEL